MKIIVPIDFTEISEPAIQHALSFAKSAEQSELILLHIIAKAGQEEEKKQQLDVLSQKFRNAQVSISTQVKQGDIFNDIAAVAEEEKANFIVMGTHGAKGLQKLLGSYAIKVINSSKVPFIITQKMQPSAGVNKIVLPVDLSKESLQIVKYATFLAKEFNAEMHVVAKPVKDEFLAKTLNNNLSIVRKHLKENNVSFELEVLEGAQSLQQEVIDYGAKHRADLFAIAHFSDSLLPQFDTFSQDMITNKLELPVLVISAKQVKAVTSTYSFIGI